MTLEAIVTEPIVIIRPSAVKFLGLVSLLPVLVAVGIWAFAGIGIVLYVGVVIGCVLSLVAFATMLAGNRPRVEISPDDNGSFVVASRKVRTWRRSTYPLQGYDEAIAKRRGAGVKTELPSQVASERGFAGQI